MMSTDKIAGIIVTIFYAGAGMVGLHDFNSHRNLSAILVMMYSAFGIYACLSYIGKLNENKKG